MGRSHCRIEKSSYNSEMGKKTAMEKTFLGSGLLNMKQLFMNDTLKFMFKNNNYYTVFKKVLNTCYIGAHVPSVVCIFEYILLTRYLLVFEI